MLSITAKIIIKPTCLLVLRAIINWFVILALPAPDHRHGVDGGGMTNQIKKITVTVTFNASCPFILFLNFVINHVNIS